MSDKLETPAMARARKRWSSCPKLGNVRFTIKVRMTGSRSKVSSLELLRSAQELKTRALEDKRLLAAMVDDMRYDVAELLLKDEHGDARD